MSSSPPCRFNYNGVPKSAAIMIILQKNGHPDDKLVIRPTDGSTNFTAVFTQNTIGVRSERSLVHSELFPYIERFLESLDYDSASCDFVQIDVPGYTSVMIKSSNVRFYMDTFYAQVRSLFNSWPTEVTGSIRTEPTYASYSYSTQTDKRSPSPRVTRSMAQQRTAF